MKELISPTLEQISTALEISDNLKNEFMLFIKNNPENFFSRDNKDGHITGSMLVFNEEGNKILLVHHLKFNKWLQFGGHNDSPYENIFQTSIREMKEEGFNNEDIDFTPLSLNPIDLDIHTAGNHKHYDICFGCIVKESQIITCSHESNEICWQSLDNMENNPNFDDRLKRMIEKSLNYYHKQFVSKPQLKFAI